MIKAIYKEGQIVKFKINNIIKEGVIYIVDKYETFEQNKEPSYDIMVTEENTLYKHIIQSMIVN